MVKYDMEVNVAELTEIHYWVLFHGLHERCFSYNQYREIESKHYVR